MIDVRLRAVTEADLPVFFEWQRDPEAVRLSKIPGREWEEFRTHWRTKVLPNPEGLLRAITADGVLAGNIVSFPFRERRCVGYWLGRDFWGKGVGTTALRQFLADVDQSRPLYIETDEGNAGSLHMAEKCGFERVGLEVEGDLRFVVLRLDD
ncbi:GNAT family N-acetyltransferase [Hamadaea sp. NPDC051192]|uniref:GNAT family N-acetyltransferase n=1 Tax=Hamadaea sp. NPDC051192 TaxID=3154940 RepID=UPI003414962A